MITRIDLTMNKKSKLCLGPKRKCECVCGKCGWKGWRMVRFLTDLWKDEFPDEAATEKLTGKKSWWGCPKCGWRNKKSGEHSVTFTGKLGAHVSG